jgi:hypothetical protein
LKKKSFDFCRPGGQTLLLGMGSERSELNFVASIRKEHRVLMPKLRLISGARWIC